MDNINPYDILGIHKNFTIEELKDKYKRVAKKTHPDKGGSEELFTLVTLCYKKLYEEYKLKQIDKQFYDLKSGFKEFTAKQNNEQRQNTKFTNIRNNQNRSQSHNSRQSENSRQSHNNRQSQNSRQNQQYQRKYNSNNNSQDYREQHKHRHQQSYNGEFSEVFNQVFDDHKISDPYDRGYGKLMLDRNDAREDINIKKTVNSMKGFNSAFDSKPVNKYNKRMIVYKEPEALPSSIKTLRYTELGVDKVKDFTTFTDNLDATDYKIAHTTEKLIDHSMVRPRENYNDIGSLQSSRSRISYQMSEEDMLLEARRQKKEKYKELKRIETQKKLDRLTAKNFDNVNKLLLGFRQ